MIPLQLTLQNFMSYRGEVTVDLSGVQLACLSGDNGAGKSALLDAITWALWGQCRAAQERDVITLHETDVAVTFEFMLGSNQYRVFRRRSGKQNRLTLEFQQRSDDAGAWRAASGDNARDTQRRINDTLKMDYDLFTNSVYLIQGKADIFTQKTPGERKRVLAEILNLDVYEALRTIARDHGKALKERQEGLARQLDQIEEQLKTRPDLERGLESVNTELEANRKQGEQLQAELTSLATNISNFETIAEARDKALASKKASEKRQAELAATIKQDQAHIEKLSALLKREDEITRATEALRAARKELEQQRELFRKRQPLELERRDLQHNIQQQSNVLEHEIAEMQRQLSEMDAYAKRANDLQQRLAQLLKEHDAQQPRIAKLAEYKSGHQATVTRVTKLNTQNDQLRSQMHEIKKRLDEITRGDGACPLCLRPLSDGDHQHVRKAWEHDGKQLGDAFRRNLKQLDQLRQLERQTSHEIASLEQEQKAFQRREATIQHTQDQAAEVAEQLKAHAQIAEKLSKLETEKQQQSRWQALLQRIGEIDQELVSIPYDAKRVHELEQQTKNGDDIEREFQQLGQARFEVEVVHKRITDAKAESERIVSTIEEADADIAKYTQKLEGADQIKQRHDGVKRALQEVTNKLSTLDRKQGSFQNQLETLDRLACERKTIKGQVGEITEDRDIYSDLDLAFGRNGIQAIIIENVLPELADMTNELLRRMSKGQLEVRFETNRSAVSRDTIIETLDIIIRDEAGERPYQLYSGGEAFRINFAIRVALSKLLARRAGATINFLVIDEGFGTQDSRGRDGLIGAIHSVEPDFSTILVVTHIDEIRDQFPQRINVVKTPGGSRVNVA